MLFVICSVCGICVLVVLCIGGVIFLVCCQSLCVVVGGGFVMGW
jgi:hypothetical protein